MPGPVNSANDVPMSEADSSGPNWFRVKSVIKRIARAVGLLE